MRAMKDSGIEWIGEISQDWEIRKFKHYFRIIGGCGFKESLQGRNIGEYPFYKASDINGRLKYVTAAQNYVEKNDVENERLNVIPCNSILISKIGEALKKNHRKINTVPCIVDNNCEGFVLKKDDSIDYLYYVLMMVDMLWFDNGGTIPSVNNEKLRDFFLPYPSIEIQQRIADYLDDKCAKIDSIIEKQKAVIEKLKEYKLSVITEAVTKGLDPNVEMKDSGIEWIGKIPSLWDLEKLKYATQIMRGRFNHRPRNDPAYYDGEYPFVQTGDVARAEKYITQYSQTLNEKGYSVSKEFPQGSICMTIAANVGDVAILNFPACFPDSVVGFVPKGKANWSYLYYVLKAMKKQLVRNAIISTQLNLNIEIIKEEFIPLPPVTEQEEISRKLDEKCIGIDNAILRKQAIIDKLTVYKKSLIYEVVTGKKEV